MGDGGSSGVLAMDGHSDDGARKSETLGEGDSSADRESEADSSVPGGSLPSCVSSDASGIEGDPTVDTGGDRPNDGSMVGQGPMLYEPEHHIDGEWDDQTLVGGKPGAWGIVCGNWGGQWHGDMLHKHMGFDLKSSAGTILLLQEATEELLQHLKRSAI